MKRTHQYRESISTFVNVMDRLRPLHDIAKSTYKYSFDHEEDHEYLHSDIKKRRLNSDEKYFRHNNNNNNNDSDDNNNNIKTFIEIEDDCFYRERNGEKHVDVISIEDKSLVRVGDEKQRVKKRRSRSTLDQLLPQVEAKKRREEEESFLRSKTQQESFKSNNLRYSTSHICLNDNISKPENEQPRSKRPAKSCSAESFIYKDNKRRLKSESCLTTKKKINFNENTISCRATNEPIPTPTKKRNKRTISTNQRYSTLSTAQLQRRLVANARERSRVHALSNAFDSLRATIPSYSTEQKLSKLTILKVAINYIKALDQILVTDKPPASNQRFDTYVTECSRILQTEYGRSKTRLSMD